MITELIIVSIIIFIFIVVIVGVFVTIYLSQRKKLAKLKKEIWEMNAQTKNIILYDKYLDHYQRIKTIAQAEWLKRKLLLILAKEKEI
ncbi:hypothetical protein [Mycoplasma leonicaptivi]|uniref:hypothetical protein n=1 Tax=Mycoplasma leonicaptivi TaxID=36742 RepID=UPI000485264D|nr:hypothetical protein [Mycoplasma leonicaptivi]